MPFLSLKPTRALAAVEILIVVAVVALLALVALTQTDVAQTRSKVARAKAQLRNVAAALEAYAVDSQAYPNSTGTGAALVPGDGPGAYSPLALLTTPVAYLSDASLLRDPFPIRYRRSAATAERMAQAPLIAVSEFEAVAVSNSLVYQACNPQQRYVIPPDSFSDSTRHTHASTYFLHSAGPDATYHNLGGVLANDRESSGPILLIYDPTNGVFSAGSIYRANGEGAGSAIYAGGSGLFRVAGGS
ncbi:MAG: type II secretion system protein GspG [Sumerlaeia bacterium]